ncbi:hypothetical protein D7V86_16920 [bacterium D16-51]|nr:hypothetical protein D7V96_19500 [bacterium D16-59]RKI57929.1 hypothetical protein D7V86_16920 [bacterium D16-51]
MNGAEKIQKLRVAFQSILRADYISIDDIHQLAKLDDYYVDYFNNVPKVLQDQDSYISGRRGTGKTALLMRCYYECLKTVSTKISKKSLIFEDKKVLPLYIDLSQCKDIFEKEDEKNIEHNFIKYLVKELKEQLAIMFEQSKMRIFKEDTSKMPEFDFIAQALMEGITIKREVTAQELTQKESSKDGIAAGMSVEKIGLDLNLEEGYETELVKSISETTNFNVQELLSALGAIRRASKIDAIYVFIDEFSDLSDAEQKEFSELLKKLLGSKNNIFFKVGTITDRYDFGEKIIIGRDIFPIFLDLNDFVEKYGGIVTALKQLEDFTTSLVNKRLASYCPDVSLNAVFDEKSNEIIARITREAMGVPRTIGMILQGALNQTELNGKRTNITISDINVGIQETRKIYFSQFQGAVKKKIIPAFYMDMWNSILNKALTEKNKNKKEPRPSSHFMLDPLRKKYMNIFCENFLVHLLEESRASKYGGNYLLFSIDYGICAENNILFAEEKDEFTAARFIYDNIIAQYDCYFVDEQLKSYQCPICKRIYKEEDVAQAKVKRCFECDEKLIEIVHREVPMTEGNYTEVEVKILGLIGSLSEEEAMSASEIGDAIGCTWQKVSNWCSKVLGKQELINVKKVGGRNYYFDKE